MAGRAGKAGRDRGRHETGAAPVAVIDIGSNSGRVMVYVREAGGHLHILAGSRASLRLVRELDRTGGIPAESLDRAFEALLDFRSIAHGSGVRRIVAAGTSALRDASNGPAFIRRVRRELGLTIRTLSGVEEARYGFLGAVGGLPVDHGALFDLGGGSLQVARFRGRVLLGAVSVPLGALRVSDAFLKSDPPSAREVRRLREHAREVLEEAGLRALSRGEELVGTGGTLRNLAKIDQRAAGYPIPRLHGYVLHAAAAARHQRGARGREGQEARRRSRPERRPARLRRGRRPRDRHAHGGPRSEPGDRVGTGRPRGAGPEPGPRDARGRGRGEAELARGPRLPLRGLVEGPGAATGGNRGGAAGGARPGHGGRGGRGAAARGAHPRHRAHGGLLRPPRARGRPGPGDRPRRLLAPGRRTPRGDPPPGGGRGGAGPVAGPAPRPGRPRPRRAGGGPAGAGGRDHRALRAIPRRRRCDARSGDATRRSSCPRSRRGACGASASASTRPSEDGSSSSPARGRRGARARGYGAAFGAASREAAGSRVLSKWARTARSREIRSSFGRKPWSCRGCTWRA